MVGSTRCDTMSGRMTTSRSRDSIRVRAAFASIWANLDRVSAPVEGDHELFGFLTTEANAIVAPVHAKAMPVILTTSEEVDRWLEANTAEALALQRALADDALRIVAKGARQDDAGSA